MASLFSYLVILAHFCNFGNGLTVSVKDPGPIAMGSVHSVFFRVIMDVHEELSWNASLPPIQLQFNLTNDKSWAFTLLNQSIEFSYDDMLWSREKALMLQANVIGFDSINVTSAGIDTLQVPLKAILADRTLNTLFTVVMLAMIVINTVNMGGQLDLAIIRQVFQRPVGPAVGFISQFVVMPVVRISVHFWLKFHFCNPNVQLSYGIGALMFEDRLFRLGLFVLGCCPGGTGSNFWTLLLNGDINLSITMTFVSTVAALGMMPLWIFLLGPYLSQGSLVIPYQQLIFTLISLVLPITLGMWIRFRFKRGAAIMKKIIVPFTLLTVLFIFTAGIYINLFIFMLMTGKMVAAGFLVAFLGYSLGAGLAYLCK